MASRICLLLFVRTYTVCFVPSQKDAYIQFSPSYELKEEREKKQEIMEIYCFSFFLSFSFSGDSFLDWPSKHPSSQKGPRGGRL